MNKLRDTVKNMNYQKLIVPAIGVIVGGIGGYLYWHEIGCTSGTCPITSKPLNSTLYGGVMGYLISDLVSDFFKKK